MMIAIGMDLGDVPKDLEALEKNLPYAAARTLTKVAGDGTEAGQQEVKSGIFHRRNTWTERGVRTTPATKENLVAEVYTDTSNWSTGAPDYLLRQEDGGERVPYGGRKEIAIPTVYLRRLAGGENSPIPDWLRPKALLRYFNGDFKYTVLRGKRKGVDRNAPVLIRGLYFFPVEFRSGAHAICCRSPSDRRDAFFPLYMLVTRANVRKRFHLEEDVRKAVYEKLEQRWNESVSEVLINGALKGSGVQIKFV